MKALVFSLAVLFSFPLEAAVQRADFYISPFGRDSWSGKLAAPDRTKSDGPFATIDRARGAVRELKRKGRKKPVIVRLRGGTYELNQAVTFGPEDSGTVSAPVIYAAYPKERVVLSGGARVTGWAIGSRWTASVPKGEVFRQLFVNGSRRYRPRLPREGYFHVARGLSPSPEYVERGYDRLGFSPADAPEGFRRPDEIEVLAFHNWFMSRMRIASADREKGILTFTGPTANKSYWADLSRGRRYILENVREELKEPGQWHLDAGAGMLTYVPLKGETPGRVEVVVPRLKELFAFQGDVAKREWVRHIVFRGISFAYTGFDLAPEGYSWAQAESALAGAINLEGARDCVFQDCEIMHTGAYGIDFGAGCRRNVVTGCLLHDLGAGGIKIGKMHWREKAGAEDPEYDAARHTVRDCTIAHGGRVHPAAVGVWIGHAAHNTIEHNDIYDFYYTGVSVGWSWGYGKSGAHHNRIAFNRVHDIGQGVLTDMGGVYTLGVSPGSYIVGNVFHSIESYDYGGWGIYFDEGTTGMVAENNLVYRTKSGGFHQHYGKDNRVENNIFAFGREGQLIRTRAEGHRSFTLRRNIVLADGAPILGSNWSGTGFELDRNLYWDLSGEPEGPRPGTTWKEWHGQRHDLTSEVQDPGFRNPKKGDFRLKPGSPAVSVGFKPFDYSKAGRLTRPHKFAPAPPAYFAAKKTQAGALPIREDFEESSPGSKTADAMTFEDNETATARVSPEAAASGSRSLKFTKGGETKFGYNPHMHYSPHFEKGVMRGAFALRLEGAGEFMHEWRDVFPNQDPWYRAGPSLWVSTEGEVTANDKSVGYIPLKEWVSFEIVCGVGPDATGTYDLVITLPGGEEKRHAGLAYEGKFERLKWFGFTSHGLEPGVVGYLDDIVLEPK